MSLFPITHFLTSVLTRRGCKCSLVDHKEVVEVDLATSWVMEETLEVVVTLAVVETSVEEEAMVAEVVAAEAVMEEVMVDIMDLEVMVARVNPNKGAVRNVMGSPASQATKDGKKDKKEEDKKTRGKGTGKARRYRTRFPPH
ncbi:hypothetical protein GH733_008504 [Mirounga leonina]|nr:hypothetical protein GH733_008504 [Mirounga leonina]